MTFIDFCAGIGGGRLGVQNAGFSCLGFSEIDKDAQLTYRTFFGNDEQNFGDLMKINPSDLPNFDLMVGGFPCQTFSIIGDRCGLEDVERGQVIYGMAKILKAKNVKYFILENVKGLINHDKGNTLKEVQKLLEESGYRVFYKILNSLNFGVPQMRERIYFVGFRKDLCSENFIFEFPKEYSKRADIKEYLIDEDRQFIFDETVESYQTFLKYLTNKYNKGKTDVEVLIKDDFMVIDTRQSDLRIYDQKSPTLRKGRHGILYVKDKKLRKLSGYEALLLQGFPKYLALSVKGKIANSELLVQSGNAMTVNVMEAITKKMLESIGLTNE